MVKGQLVFVTPTYAVGNTKHKDSEKAVILSVSTYYCFVELEKSKKIEIVDNNLIVKG